MIISESSSLSLRKTAFEAGACPVGDYLLVVDDQASQLTNVKLLAAICLRSGWGKRASQAISSGMALCYARQA